MNYLIIGGSKGIGSAFVQELPAKGDTVWAVSRTDPEFPETGDEVKRHWIEADLSTPQEATNKILGQVKDEPVDVLIYNAGIWESKAFQDDYNFEEDDPKEIEEIITVNLTAAIICIQKLLGNIRQSKKGKIILIGSTAGLDNSTRKEVAYCASKFGLRGLTHALRENVREDKIGVTCLNLGDASTNLDYEKEELLELSKGKLVPIQEVVDIVKNIIALSWSTNIKEIDIPSMLDIEV